LSAAISSVLRAENLPALLAAAYGAFECALQALRGAEDHAGPLLPAFVLAAAAAADGRDAVAAARSFPGPGSPLVGNMTSPAAIDVADQVAGDLISNVDRRRRRHVPHERGARASRLPWWCSVTSGGRLPGWRPRRRTRIRQPGPGRFVTSLSPACGRSR
jgi:hypothetical protein